MKIDASNKFKVTMDEDGICVSPPDDMALRFLSKPDALLLAAWLAHFADDADYPTFKEYQNAVRDEAIRQRKQQ
jgi:hypothetical protein